MSDLVGQQLDVYKILRLIGKGGMGEVYEAEHAIMGRRCAVKVMTADVTVVQESIARMIREAQAVSAIGHPNIVQVYDFRQAPDGTYYMAMELLSGKPLSELLNEHGRQEINAAVAIMVQVLSAVQAAHGKGIVHRDLKPENIFIAETVAGHHEIKLLDFGISKFMRPSPENLRLTKTGAILGTPYYMSPEQASGSADIGTATDLWSCGAILYELVTGAVPFAGNSYNQVMAAILLETINKPTILRPECPGWLEDVIRRALKKKPDDRFGSAAEFLDTLLKHHSPSDVQIGSFVIRHTLSPRRAAPVPSTAVPLPPPPPDARPPGEASGRVVFDGSAPVPSPGMPPKGTLTDGERVSQRLPQFTQERQARKKKLLYGLVAGGCVLAGLLVVAGIVSRTDKKPGEEPGARSTHDAQARYSVYRPQGGNGGRTESVRPDRDAGPAAGGRPADGRGPPAARADASAKKVETIKITLKNLPRKARITLDGDPVKPPIKIEADGKRRCLEVFVPGQPLYARCFDADRNKVFRLPGPPGKERRRPRIRRLPFRDPYRGRPYRDPYTRRR